MIELNFMYFHEILLYHYTTLYHKMYRIFKISIQAAMPGHATVFVVKWNIKALQRMRTHQKDI